MLKVGTVDQLQGQGGKDLLYIPKFKNINVVCMLQCRYKSEYGQKLNYYKGPTEI